MAKYELLETVIHADDKIYGPKTTPQNNLDYPYYEGIGMVYGGDVIDEKLVSASALKFMLDNRQVKLIETSAHAAPENSGSKPAIK